MTGQPVRVFGPKSFDLGPLFKFTVLALVACLFLSICVECRRVPLRDHMAQLNLTRIPVSDPSAFDDALRRAHEEVSDDGLVFVIAHALDWCPDSQKAWPGVKAALESIAEKRQVVYLDCHVVREGYKGNPDHPYRKNGLQIKSIPTLVYWPRSGPASRCEPDKADELDEFVRPFLS